MNKNTICLWYERDAEEAARHHGLFVTYFRLISL